MLLLSQFVRSIGRPRDSRAVCRIRVAARAGQRIIREANIDPKRKPAKQVAIVTALQMQLPR